MQDQLHGTSIYAHHKWREVSLPLSSGKIAVFVIVMRHLIVNYNLITMQDSSSDSSELSVVNFAQFLEEEEPNETN